MFDAFLGETNWNCNSDLQNIIDKNNLIFDASRVSCFKEYFKDSFSFETCLSQFLEYNKEFNGVFK